MSGWSKNTNVGKDDWYIYGIAQNIAWGVQKRNVIRHPTGDTFQATDKQKQLQQEGRETLSYRTGFGNIAWRIENDPL